MAILPLTINGKQIRQLEALRENFDLVSVLEYYKNGKLLKWLQDRFYEDEAAAVEALDETAPDFAQQLCVIFGVAYSGEEIDIEEIAQKQERIAKLRTYTDDAEIIENIALVVFDQEELAELLHSGTEKIYLCGDSFAVPASQKNKTYIGVNNPSVHISGKIPENWSEQDIEFLGCTVDNLPEEAVPSTDTGVNFNSGVDISGETVDRILSLSAAFSYGHIMGPYINGLYETQNYIFLCDFLFNKRTGEEKRLKGGFSPSQYTRHEFSSVFVSNTKDISILADRIFYYGKEQKSVLSLDLNTLVAPKKLFSLEDGSGCKPLISVAGRYFAFCDYSRGLRVYDTTTDDTVRIPTPKARGNASAIYAVEGGVYFSWEDYPSYTMHFFDYATRKTTELFATKECIYYIYHIDSQKFYVRYGFDQYGIIDLTKKAESKLGLTTVLDVMDVRAYNSHISIKSYDDCLVYVAKGGVIKTIDYKTGEITSIADGAYEHHYLKGGLFTSSSSWNTPAYIGRIGDWICYESKDKEPCRVHLKNPNKVERINDISTLLSDKEIRELFSDEEYYDEESFDASWVSDSRVSEKLKETVPAVVVE